MSVTNSKGLGHDITVTPVFPCLVIFGCFTWRKKASWEHQMGDSTALGLVLFARSSSPKQTRVLSSWPTWDFLFLVICFSLMKLRTRYCVELFPGKPSHMRFCRPRMTTFTRQIILDGTFLFTHTCQLSPMVGVHSYNLNFVHIHISLENFHIYKWQPSKTFVKQERPFHRWGLL